MLTKLGFLLHPPWKKVINGSGTDGSFTRGSEQDELSCTWAFLVIDEVETVLQQTVGELENSLMGSWIKF